MSEALEIFRNRANDLIVKLILGSDELSVRVAEALQELPLNREFSELSCVSKETRDEIAELLSLEGIIATADLIERVERCSSIEIRKIVALIVESVFDVVDLTTREDERASEESA